MGDFDASNVTESIIVSLLSSAPGYGVATTIGARCSIILYYYDRLRCVIPRNSAPGYGVAKVIGIRCSCGDEGDGCAQSRSQLSHYVLIYALR